MLDRLLTSTCGGNRDSTRCVKWHIITQEEMIATSLAAQKRAGIGKFRTTYPAKANRRISQGDPPVSVFESGQE